MTEPDVTLTDYGLALECGLFAYLLWRRGDPALRLRRWFTLFFGSVGLAAFLGGTVHGFFLDVATTGYRLLWPATLLAIGLAGFAAWGTAATIQFSGPAARAIPALAGILLAGYAVLVISGMKKFVIAIVFYLPAAAFLLGVLALTYGRTAGRQVLAATAGLALTFVASGLQQAGIGLHPMYFNHNALYHLIQAVALLLIFWGARWLATARPAQ